MRPFSSKRRRIIPAAGLAALALVSGLSFADPFAAATRLREAAFDRLIAAAARAPADRPVVILDIDRAALDRFGSWPWPRDRLAGITIAAMAAKPAALAFDMVLAESRGAALADAAAPDLDRLAAALDAGPSVLGAVLDPANAAAGPEGPPVILRGAAPDLSALMLASGVTAPAPKLRQAAKGIGILTLAAPEGEPIRRAPLLAAGGGTLYAGLGVEALRVATGDGNLVIEDNLLRIGPHIAPLAPDASLRLWPATAAHRAARVMPVLQLLDSPDQAASRLAGKIVLIGASAPEAGGLRATAADPFTPTAQIHADLIEQIIGGQAPARPRLAWAGELVAGIVLALLAIAGVMLLTPGRAALGAIALAALWCGLCALLWFARAWLIDPAWPALTGLGAWQAASFAAFAETRARRLALERSFATRLPPEIVARLADNPDQLKLAGEEREITALFTDIEGFTALTERIGATDLVALLDRYFDCVCTVVTAHGGMVDKFVGDAVHAFFNAPVDLPDHANRAVDCAIAIDAAAQAFRSIPENAVFNLGRTRIGVETGRAVLGDVGAGRKLDYTAHGPAINLASRLEASNKTFNSTIAVGPGCVKLATRHRFRELGEITPFAGAAPVMASEPVRDGAQPSPLAREGVAEGDG